MTKSFQMIDHSVNLPNSLPVRHWTFIPARKKFHDRSERLQKFSAYLERHPFTAWLVSFIAAPLAVLGSVALLAAIAGGFLLAVLQFFKFFPPNTIS